MKKDKYIYPTTTHKGETVYRLTIPYNGKWIYITQSTDKTVLRKIRDEIIVQDYTLETLQEYKRDYHHKKMSMKHIVEYTVSKGKKRYMIHHSRDGKTHHHGSYNTLHEAQRVRDCLVENDWDETVCPVSVNHRGPRNPLNRYISRDSNGRYVVARSFRGDDGVYKRVVFESGIRSLSDARCLRDWWVDHEWDWSSIDLA